MAYVRKTQDEWEVQGYYCGCWEYVCSEETYKEAKITLSEYRANEPYRFRVVKRRVPKEDNMPKLYRVNVECTETDMLYDTILCVANSYDEAESKAREDYIDTCGYISSMIAFTAYEVKFIEDYAVRLVKCNFKVQAKPKEE